ncbi:hypothetical protein BGZ65_002678 [Modicella reniformis]|uniref:VOC domain-containing protein n=1 Tax=Modicella reniformis TaxID=1440133 RepID=A0A9P6SU04_9FUNG|nr:hypothetical protein BGZ65_002678 [Modicella reniformis]
MSKTGAINHVALSVSDYDRGVKFYDFLLQDILGYDTKIDVKCCMLYMSKQAGACICLSEGNQVNHHKLNPGLHHLAFSAATRELIDDFYLRIVQFQKAEENKNIVGLSAILDEPKDYPQYGKGYYAVFFTDPDGIKLEIAYTPQH